MKYEDAAKFKGQPLSELHKAEMMEKKVIDFFVTVTLPCSCVVEYSVNRATSDKWTTCKYPIVHKEYRVKSLMPPRTDNCTTDRSRMEDMIRYKKPEMKTFDIYEVNYKSSGIVRKHRKVTNISKEMYLEMVKHHLDDDSVEEIDVPSLRSGGLV